MPTLRPPSAPLSISLVTAALLAAAYGAGCGSSTPALSTGGAGTTGTATGAAGDLKIPVGMTKCSNGLDDDMDGLVDLLDPECVGSADNDEATFATGIPGDNIDACKQDCFFDGNSGMGNDGCLWQLQCDPLNANTKCPYSTDYASKHMNECSISTSQPQKCIDNCRKYVPNGCDCFGCCAVPGAATPIRLDPTCTAKDFKDPTKCSPCTQVTQCMNVCERCELCIGKETVPADCGYSSDGGAYDGGPPDAGYGTPVCTGYQSCIAGSATASCPTNFTCVTGCCLPIVP